MSEWGSKGMIEHCEIDRCQHISFEHGEIDR